MGSKSRMQGKVLPEPNAMPAVYAGIDVCKEWLDVHVHPARRKFRVSQRPVRPAAAEPRAGRAQGEAGGDGGDRQVPSRGATFAACGGPAVAVVDPLRARLFAKACGCLAKTDGIDARLLALMGEASSRPHAAARPRHRGTAGAGQCPHCRDCRANGADQSAARGADGLPASRTGLASRRQKPYRAARRRDRTADPGRTRLRPPLCHLTSIPASDRSPPPS